MNKRRRRIGKARRHRARLVREIRAWTGSSWTAVEAMLEAMAKRFLRTRTTAPNEGEERRNDG